VQWSPPATLWNASSPATSCPTVGIVLERICWQIIPLGGQEMWLVDNGKAEKALVTPSTQAIYPDKWLSPIKGKSVAPVIRELRQHDLLQTG